MPIPKDPKAGLDTRTYKKLCRAAALISNQTRVARMVRQWILARNSKGGTKYIANHLWHAIQAARAQLDLLEEIICREPGIPIKRKGSSTVPSDE